MARLFGTDGIRGIANKDITCSLAYKLGQALVVFQGKTILVGRDTRISGEMFEAAACAGIASMGGTALTTGIMPTPGVALLVSQLQCDGAIVISASHNPPEYNGLKVFDGQGYKLPDSEEDEIESFIRQGGASAHELAQGVEVGSIVRVEDAVERYVNHAVDAIRKQGVSLEGMKVALDCGHGASALCSRRALQALGAKVYAINEDYNGCDINVKCGSTHLDPVKELVKQVGACVGIAHDGDADRVMMVDSDGNEIDGDMIGAVLAIDLKGRQRLAHNTFVGTVMCNIGLSRTLEKHGISVVQVHVGDRYVLEEMRNKGYNLGGEQSGHMIMLNHNSTGDGLMTAVQFLAAVVRSGKSVEEAVGVVTKFPQVLINVSGVDKNSLNDCAPVWESVSEAQKALANSGRVLLRPSGTEPLVRVMVEAASNEEAQHFANHIAKIVKDNLACS